MLLCGVGGREHGNSAYHGSPGARIIIGKSDHAEVGTREALKNHATQTARPKDDDPMPSQGGLVKGGLLADTRGWRRFSEERV
jgi:hypothetical protein